MTLDDLIAALLRQRADGRSAAIVAVQDVNTGCIFLPKTVEFEAQVEEVTGHDQEVGSGTIWIRATDY